MSQSTLPDYPGIYAEAGTGVFWDVGDFPIPEGLNPKLIYENIQLSLKRRGYRGTVSILMYGEENTLPPKELRFEYEDAGFQLFEGFKSVREKMMLVDILLCVLQNSCISNLMFLSSKIKEEPTVNQIFSLHLRGSNVFLADPPLDWKYPNESPKWLLEPPSETMPKSTCPDYVGEAGTCVFWDVVDFPIPEGLNPKLIYANIQLSLKRNGYRGPVSILMLGDENTLPPKDLRCEYEDAGFRIREVAGVKSLREHLTLLEILFCVLENHLPSNLMILSKILNCRTTVYHLLGLCFQGYNVLLSDPSPEFLVESSQFHHESPQWLLEPPSDGGNSSFQSGCSQHVEPNSIADTFA